MNILVTGGAGFIGSFLVDELVKLGHKVTIFDNLEPQVHHGKIPAYLNKDAKFIKADVCDRKKLDKALEHIDIVFHEASVVGIGQSMYEIEKYVKANLYGTSILLDLIVNKHRDHIKKLILAGSMSEYGEGLYNCRNCGNVKPPLRNDKQLNQKRWELFCPNCKSILIPKPTTEETPLSVNSIYAISKKSQEEMCLTIGKTFSTPTVVLRYFNVYGPRQSLSNPYTGVAAIFVSRIKSEKDPIVFEDGNQTRDFVSVHDVVGANIAAMINKKADYKIFNVGSGTAVSIAQLGWLLIKLLNPKLKLDIVNKFRKGDIRHCIADISKIKSELKWHPKIGLQNGLLELISWSKKIKSNDFFEKAQKELAKRGLV